MFRAVPLSIIMSFSLYTQQWYMSYKFADGLQAGSGQNQFRPDPKFKVPLYLLKYTHVILCSYVYVGDNYGAVSYTSYYQVFCTRSCKHK